MVDCAFCQIVSGELPSFTVYKDGKYMAFLDIAPYALGQVNIIPKNHYRWVDDVPDFGSMFEIARKIGLAIRGSLAPDAVYYITQGLEMSHAHIKVIPIRLANNPKGEISESMRRSYPQNEMKITAEKIQSGLKYMSSKSPDSNLKGGAAYSHHRSQKTGRK
jgi:histidine triad (HIT) family protein